MIVTILNNKPLRQLRRAGREFQRVVRQCCPAAEVFSFGGKYVHPDVWIATVTNAERDKLQQDTNLHPSTSCGITPGRLSSRGRAIGATSARVPRSCGQGVRWKLEPSAVRLAQEQILSVIARFRQSSEIRRMRPFLVIDFQQAVPPLVFGTMVNSSTVTCWRTISRNELPPSEDQLKTNSCVRGI